MVGLTKRLCASLMALAMLMAPAWAEEQGDEVLLEAVKVSAQKREENVQEIPLSVGVLSDVQLEDSRIEELTDLGKNIPNLYIGTAGGTGTYTFIGVRGRINSTLDVDPTVTVLVDGVPYDDFFSMGNNLLYDVERVEVLRGPQSTLYGLNSAAGVINVVTKEPGETNKVMVTAEGSYGPSWNGTGKMGGSVSGPIHGETLKGSLAVIGLAQEGYIRNVYSGNRFNDDRNGSARGNLVWRPSEAWKVSPGVSYSVTEADYGFINMPIDSKAASAASQTFKAWQWDVDWEGGTDVSTLAPNLKIDYDAGFADFVAVSAYKRTLQKFDFDSNFTPTGGANGFGKYDNDLQSFSQELRLQSKAEEGDQLTWLAGYFYNVFDRHQQIFFGNADTGLVTSTITNVDFEGDSHAFFTQGTYRFMDDKLGLTAGLRVEFTTREMSFRSGSVDDADFDDAIYLPKVALDYRYSPETMLYASITRGWRSGGVNPFRTANNNLTYDQETTWTLEAGSKNTWDGGRDSFNLTAFYTLSENFQDRIADGFTNAYISNVPEVVMIGLEAEGSSMLTDNLQLSGFFGYVHAEYTDPVTSSFKGKQVVGSPDFNANLALKYTFMEHFYIRPELVGVGNIYWDRNNSKKQNPYMLANFKGGYAKDNYDIYVFGENMTNHYAFTYALDNANLSDEFFGTPITPLRMGVGLNLNF